MLGRIHQFLKTILYANLLYVNSINILQAAFMCLQFVLVFCWQEEIGELAACTMW